MGDGIRSIAPPSLPALPVTTKKASGGDSPDKIKDTAQQFEALMINELLKASHAGDSGWMGTGEEDQTGQTAMDMAQQQLASVMAKKGGLGLTEFITHSLGKHGSGS